MEILIADDDPIIIESLSAGLKQNGFDVIAAIDGQQAVALARENIPSLIILDATMPKLDGFRVLRELKKDPDTVDIPVLILTARRTTGDMLAAKSVGANGYLAKPVDLQILLDRIHDLTI